MKATIEVINGEYVYFDKEGNELHDGDYIQWDNGKVEQICHTESGQLGTDATNPKWIEIGRAVPFEYGAYPLEPQEMAMIVKIER